MGNPLSMTLLCRDKVKSQAFLEQAGIDMPPVESDPRQFNLGSRNGDLHFSNPDTALWEQVFNA